MRFSPVKLQAENSKSPSLRDKWKLVTEKRVSIDDKETMCAKNHTRDEVSEKDVDHQPSSVRLKKVTPTMPAKRTLHKDDSLLRSPKKRKEPCEFDYDKDEVDIPISQRIEMKGREVEAKRHKLYSEMRLKEEQCDKEIKLKEARIDLLERLMRRTEQEFKKKEMENQQVLDNIDKDRERKERELKALSKKIAECTKELKVKEDKLDAKKKSLESESKKLLGIMSSRTSLSAQVMQLEKTKSQREEQIAKMESKEKEFEGHVRELELKEEEFEGRLKKLELKEDQLEKKEKDLEAQLKKHELNEKQFEARSKELQSEKNKFDEKVKEFESKEKQFEELVKELDLKQKQLNEKQFEAQLKELESEKNKSDEKVKKFELKEKQFEESKDPEVKEKQCEALVKSSEGEKVMDENETGLDSVGNDMLVNLRASSDPAKLVLDIIQNPIGPQCRKGDNAVIINSSHIILLEQLMRISPLIKPQVREEAMKLARDLRANMRASTENSLVGLAFLLLLSIYGLVSSFDEDEVLKHLEFAAHHNQAVELFRTLGFADKVSDFVKNLMKKQQHMEAVRFICAYEIADKHKTVDLLREYVQNAKLISESCCEETTSFEIKDKARDQEIAALGTVVQCMSQDNIESEDLFKEIQDRILELNSHKAYSDFTDIRAILQKCYKRK